MIAIETPSALILQTPTIASANHPTETNRLQAPLAEFVDSTNARVTHSITATRTPSAEICRMDTVAAAGKDSTTSRPILWSPVVSAWNSSRKRTTTSSLTNPCRSIVWKNNSTRAFSVETTTVASRMEKFALAEATVDANREKDEVLLLENVCQLRRPHSKCASFLETRSR